MLIDLEKTVSKTSTTKAETGRVYREPADDLKRDIFEDPNAAAEKNWTVFSRKFEAQKNQIIDELTLVVQRESDRVVRELKGSAHERIRDRVRFLRTICPIVVTYTLQSIHEIWVEMVHTIQSFFHEVCN